MDLKTPERRAMPRLRVQFRTTLRIPRNWKGLASCSICLRADVASRVHPVVPGFSLELRIMCQT